MNLFQRIKIWKELKRLENRAREEPSPSTFVDLGQVYLNMSMSDRAVQVAEEGLALFPESDELRKLRKVAGKSEANARIGALRAQLNKVPEPQGYRELATLQLETGDSAQAISTCEECIRRYPDDAGAYLVVARARLTSFYRDLSARDGLEAARCLQKVVSLDGADRRSRRLLLDLYYRVGAASAAQPLLKALEAQKAGDPELKAIGEQLAKQTGGEDLEVLFHNVEASGRLTNAPITRPRTAQRPGADDSLGRIRSSLASIAEMPGVRKAAYIKGAKALVKGEIKNGKDGFLKSVRVVTKASQRFARRLDIGSFSKGCMAGDFGHICVCSFGDVVAAVQCDREDVVDRVLVDLQELVAGSLFSNPTVRS